MKLKVLLGPSSFGSQDPAPIKFMEDLGIEVIDNPFKRKLTKDELFKELKGITGLIAGLEPLDREVLEASELKALSRCGSGISNVDLDACEELGIHFSSTPYGPTQAVAELTLAMIINLLRDVWPMHSALCGEKWDKRVGFQLKGKTVCIVGFGKIGRRTASLLAPFDVTLLAVDPFLSGTVDGAQVVSLDEALPQSDIVVLHASGEECILDKAALDKLKDGAFICNAARGQNVDEVELMHALDAGTVAGAWLDSFSEEPYCGPLCGHPQVILTPHVGSYTREGRRDMEMEAAENLVAGLREKGLLE